MNEMGSESCKTDHDVWFCSAIKDKITDYYQYFLLYTNNILVIMKNPEDFICHELGKIFVVKPNSIRPPTQYLWNKLSYVTLENGRNARSFSSSQYVQYAVKNVINTLAQEGRTFPKRGKSPWTSNCRPDTDTSPELPAPRYAYYQYLIGVIWWIAELGRVDITMETSAMASMMAMPWEGHPEHILQMLS